MIGEGDRHRTDAPREPDRRLSGPSAAASRRPIAPAGRRGIAFPPERRCPWKGEGDGGRAGGHSQP
jgi:hypothetical protein